ARRPWPCRPHGPSLAWRDGRDGPHGSCRERRACGRASGAASHASPKTSPSFRPCSRSQPAWTGPGFGPQASRYSYRVARRGGARWRVACVAEGFTVFPTLFEVGAGLDGTWVWAAGIPLFEPVGAAGCAASAELAIRLVASSAAANFVNIVISFFGALGDLRHCQGDVYTPATERALKWHSD